MRYDFTQDIPSMPKYVVIEPELNQIPPKTMDDAIIQREEWKSKYYQLLEKYLAVLEEKLVPKQAE